MVATSLNPWVTGAGSYCCSRRMKPGHEDEIAVTAGTMLDELWIKRLEEMGIDEIRSALPDYL